VSEEKLGDRLARITKLYKVFVANHCDVFAHICMSAAGYSSVSKMYLIEGIKTNLVQMSERGRENLQADTLESLADIFSSTEAISHLKTRRLRE
jgi:hypothetical protein